VTAIEWTDVTWNPISGCDRVSPGCDNCYALAMAKRLKAMGQAKYQLDGDPRTSGPGFAVTTHPDALDVPLRLRKPRRIFAVSMGDLFHPQVTDDFIAQVFAVMSMCPQHTFQVLTKRARRMVNLLSSSNFWLAVNAARLQRGVSCLPGGGPVLLPNLWLGVSAENQEAAKARIPALLFTPAAVRWVSVEPMLGPVDLLGVGVDRAKSGMVADVLAGEYVMPDGERSRIGVSLDWVVCGGESGISARPIHPDWARSLRDQCVSTDTPFLFKQWGEWCHSDQMPEEAYRLLDLKINLSQNHPNPHRIGKRHAGRELDGQIWDQYP